MVLRGALVVEHEWGQIEVGAFQAVLCQAGEWVRYSSPGQEGAEYIAVWPAGVLPGDRAPGRAVRKLILMMSVSVDGFFEGPDHDLGWGLVDEEFLRHVNEELATKGAFLHGRVTYELMANFWPTADQDPEATPEVAQFARMWRDMPKLVYSRTLEVADWNATVVREVVPEEILALKAKPGGDLMVGNADLGATFMRHDLIDEYRIYVHPVAIGRGRRLFPEDARLDLRLLDTRTFGNGVVLLRYEPDADRPANG